MTTRPKVSVPLPTYNQEAFVADSIESVLDQDYDSLQVVIGDDCSQDATWRIVQEYERKHPGKVTAFRNEHNLGISRNLNEILTRCTGDYIAFHAGDDIFLPGKLSSQVSAMEANRQIVLSHHNVEVFRSDDGRTMYHTHSGPGSSPPVKGSAARAAAKVIEQCNSLAATSVMIRRRAMVRAFDPRIVLASDWLMWIEVLANASTTETVAFLPKPLSRYRKHDNNVSLQNDQMTIDALMTLAIVEQRYPEFIPSTDRAHALLRCSLGEAEVIGGQARRGRHRLWRSAGPGRLWRRPLYFLAASYVPSLLRLRGLLDHKK